MIACLSGPAETLTIVLAGAKTSVDAAYSVLKSAPGARMLSGRTNGVTAVTILTGSLGGDVNVDGIQLNNADTGAITATINRVVDGTSYPLLTITLQSGDLMVWESGSAPQVIDSNGNRRSAASSLTTEVMVFSGATGVNEIRVPTNLADALSLESSAGDIFAIDTSTGAVVFSFGANVRLNVLGSAQIGNATADLVAFHGSTPTDQCAAYVQTFSTADRTHAARTATALTDNSAGTANTTIQALADGTTYANDVAAIRNNFADLAAAVNALIVDLADTASVVNAIVDDLQEKGLAG